MDSSDFEVKPTLIIGKVWPEPRSTAAGWRTLNIIHASQKGGHRVIFACAAQRNQWCDDLHKHGIETQQIVLNDSSFDTWVSALNPEIVIFDRYMTEEQFGWRVEKAVPHALRILDTSDLHCLREARKESLDTGLTPNLHNDTALREIAAIYRSDLTLMISEAEIRVLEESFAIHSPLVAYWPFAVAFGAERKKSTYEKRTHCAMLGSFMHPPNVDSVRWCISEIWPRIREKLPEVELHIYGSYCERSEDIRDIPEEGIFIKGRARDSIETLSQYRLSLAPLRYGAGLKGKVIDAARAGTPSIYSSVAAEGIFDMSTACDDPEDFANTSIALYSDSARWNVRSEEQFQHASQIFCSDNVFKKWRQIIADALAYKDQRRGENFIGRMLRHHHHRSTEFMSRWIELKNSR